MNSVMQKWFAWRPTALAWNAASLVMAGVCLQIMVQAVIVGRYDFAFLAALVTVINGSLGYTRLKQSLARTKAQE